MRKLKDYLTKRLFDDLSVFLIISFGVLVSFASFGTFTQKEYMELKAAERYREKVTFNYLGKSSEYLRKRLGVPYFKEPLRETEELHYWDYGPYVKIQVHFHNNRASRIAYITSSAKIRDALEYNVIQQFGRNVDWKIASLDVKGHPLETRLNKSRKLSLVKYKDAVMVYGYLVQTQKQT